MCVLSITDAAHFVCSSVCDCCGCHHHSQNTDTMHTTHIHSSFPPPSVHQHQHHHRHQHHHYHHTGSDRLVTLVFTRVAHFMAELSGQPGSGAAPSGSPSTRDRGDGAGSAHRRRERRLRSFLRHERLAVAMALAQSFHDSAYHTTTSKNEQVEEDDAYVDRSQSAQGTVRAWRLMETQYHSVQNSYRFDVVQFFFSN